MKRGCIAEEMFLFLLVGLSLLATFFSGAAVAQETESNPYAGDRRITIYKDVVYGKEDANQQILEAYIVKCLKPARLGKPAAPSRTP